MNSSFELNTDRTPAFTMHGDEDTIRILFSKTSEDFISRIAGRKKDLNLSYVADKDDVKKSTSLIDSSLQAQMPKELEHLLNVFLHGGTARREILMPNINHSYKCVEIATPKYSGCYILLSTNEAAIVRKQIELLVNGSGYDDFVETDTIAGSKFIHKT